ncbi:MAG: type II toxin-antitoxin system VapC family toxin [Phycisphaerales bacterium]|nr:type II toxin-antitoxin system VapC family toxin [Phycisphaerales bacterium]
MTPCFADAYYFLALLNPRDEAHAAAVAINRGLRRPLVTSAFILMEVADGLAGTPGRALFRRLHERLTNDDRVTLVPPTAAIFDRAATLYASRADKAWSLTDCTSFVIMEDRGIREALTGDHYFEQAGLVALLKPRTP